MTGSNRDSSLKHESIIAIGREKTVHNLGSLRQRLERSKPNPSEKWIKQNTCIDIHTHTALVGLFTYTHSTGRYGYTHTDTHC